MYRGVNCTRTIYKIMALGNIALEEATLLKIAVPEYFEWDAWYNHGIDPPYVCI